MEPFVILFFVLFAGVIGFFIFQMSTKGIKGAFFGGKVIRKLGTIELGTSAVASQNLHIYEVDKSGEIHIGFELASKAAFGFSANYFTVPKTKSKDLARMIVGLEQDAEQSR